MEENIAAYNDVIADLPKLTYNIIHQPDITLFDSSYIPLQTHLRSMFLHMIDPMLEETSIVFDVSSSMKPIQIKASQYKDFLISPPSKRLYDIKNKLAIPYITMKVTNFV